MKRLFFFIIFFFSTASVAEAQWALVFPNFVPPIQHSNKSGGIFYTIGMLWACGGSNVPPIILYSSNDSGNTWISHSINFPNYSSVGSIDFFDKLHGVITVRSTVGVTNDGGQTWNFPSPNTSFYDATIIGNVNNIIGTRWGQIMRSVDGGNSWSFISTTNGSSSLVVSKRGTIFVGNNPVLMSTDYGNTWTPRKGSYDLDSYSSAIGHQCNDSTIYVASEDFSGNGQPSSTGKGYGQFKASTDGGDSFFDIVTKPVGYISGAVTTSKHAAFCPTLNDGIYRTTDKGKTWTSIGGPPVQNDCRSIAAINDTILFVIDSLGNLWKTTNCGGYPIKAPPPEYPFVQGVSITSLLACDSGSATAKLIQTYCQPLFLTSATLEGVDAPYFTLDPVTLPDTLYQNDSRTFSLSFDPKKQVRSFSAKLHLKGKLVFEDDTLAFDTLIDCKAKTTPVKPNLTASRLSLLYDTLSTCGRYQDTTITFTNKGCDTLRIISGPGVLAPEFTIVGTLQLPIILKPDSSVSITFRFKPTATGTFFSSPTFLAEQQGLKQTLNIFLEGFGIYEGGVLSYAPKRFDFTSLSICSRDSAGGYFTNIGCDVLSVDPLTVLGNQDFTTQAPITTRQLSKGDTVTYKVYLNPARKGIRQGQIILASHVASATAVDTIPITVTVTDGTRILNSSATALHFGKTNLCDERDSVFTLKNTGCDTVVISNVDLQGSGFTTNAQTPIILLPGQSQDISINTKIDTLGGKTNNSAVISFTSDADNTISPITLDRTFSYPKRFDLSMTIDSLNATAGSIIVVSITGGLGLGQPNSGVNILDVDLTLNEDLLGYLQYISPNTITRTGKHLTITGNPELQSLPNGKIVELQYRVFLTKDSTTDITISNLKLNGGGNNSLCAPKITNTNTAFSYRFECADHNLQRYLNNQLPLKIVSLRPNPAKDAITIDFRTNKKDDCTIEIIDLLGNTISSYVAHPSESPTMTLPIGSLANGSYIIRLQQQLNTISQRFVKEQ